MGSQPISHGTDTNKNRLVVAGVDVLAAQGPASAIAGYSLSDLAAELGMSSSALRRIVRSKQQWEDIFLPYLADRTDALGQSAAVGYHEGMAGKRKGAGFRGAILPTLLLETPGLQQPYMLSRRHLGHLPTQQRTSHLRAYRDRQWELVYYPTFAGRGRRPSDGADFATFVLASAILGAGLQMSVHGFGLDTDKEPLELAAEAFVDFQFAYSEPASSPFGPDHVAPDVVPDLEAPRPSSELAVIDASLNLLMNRGVSSALSGLSTREVARSANVSVGLLHHNWESMTEFRAAVLDQMLSAKRADFSLALGVADPNDPTSILTTIFTGDNGSQELAVLFGCADLDPQLSAIVRRHADELIERLCHTLGVSTAKAIVLLAIMYGISTLLAIDPELESRLLEPIGDRPLAAALIDVVLAA